jgi:hypothetical protein
MHVDKAGRDDLIARIDHGLRLAGRDAPDARDAPVFDSDVSAKPGIARAVYDARIGDDEVVALSIGLPGGSEFGCPGEGQHSGYNETKKKRTINHQSYLKPAIECVTPGVKSKSGFTPESRWS